jgi:putative ATP-dependent endonuclease of the OLD family
MATIRHLKVENFRSVAAAEWFPKSGLNCLIGPGDSGKSTLLDAIDLVLGARRSYSFNDADFHQMNTENPIRITATLGSLNEELKNLESYGHFLRGFEQSTGKIHDEPQADLETVLTLQLVVGEDLEPEWRLYSDRAAEEGLERGLKWKHRELVHPTRLGAISHHHLAWGNRSVLNKISEETFDVSSSLAELSRQTRVNFAEQDIPELTQVLEQVRSIANSLGVPVGELKALLDVKGLSLSNGAISLHNSDNTPLRQMGTGSSRLLISGLQKCATKSDIIIVDEAEYGLEPYRITRLLQQLGSKDTNPEQQVFLTTHSPYVLRELQAEQLHVIRKIPPNHLPPPPQVTHLIFSLNGGDQEQGTLRACAEAFFSKAVIVGEGSTELGIVRGLDLFYQALPAPGFNDRGVASADGGGGDNYFKRAEVFAMLGYPTALLKDSDIITPAHAQQTAISRQRGVSVLEWGHGLSTEGALFLFCPLNVIPLIVRLAESLNGQQEVDQHISNSSNGQLSLQLCTSQPNEAMRGPLGNAAGSYKWFKNIAKAEALARTIIGPHFRAFDQRFQNIIDSLYRWASENGDQR